MAQPRVSRLRGIALAAPNATAAADFYVNGWGLREVAQTPGAIYLRASGPEHHVLTLCDSETKGIAYLNFAAQNQDSLKALFKHVEASGARIVAPIRDLDTPGGGTGFDTVDPENRRLRISTGVELYPDVEPASDRPRKITHVVLNAAKLEESLKFYEEVLGFRVSDWSENQMVFIRCNADHHSISLNRAEFPALNHVAFEMPGIDAQMRGIGRLKQLDCPVRWGVGRHGPGNNVFAYFVDPNGFVIEYTTEVQVVDESTHEPQVWKRVPHLMDRWGTAGPPSPEMRKAMAGVPDPGFQG